MLPGDWWGARLRESAVDPVELRTSAPPDGTPHFACPLAMVDLTALAVLEDCRPTFDPLVGRHDTCVCTVTVFPGDDLQGAFDSLPASGGEVCLAAGLYPLRKPVVVQSRARWCSAGWAARRSCAR